MHAGIPTPPGADTPLPPEQTPPPPHPPTPHLGPDTPPDQGADPPWTRHPPTPDQPPRTRPPQDQTPPTPRDQAPPREADSSIRSTGGRYASYWNAFLLLITCTLNNLCLFQCQICDILLSHGKYYRLSSK